MSNENALIIGVVVLCVLIAGTLLLGGGMFYGGMGGMMGYGGFGMGGFGWFFMILIIVVLVLLIVWLMKQIQNPGGKK